jgi:hypothetical protein
MADQSPRAVTLSAPDFWESDALSISHFQPRWESIQVNPSPGGGRLIECVVDDKIVFRARLDRAAASRLAALLT